MTCGVILICQWKGMLPWLDRWIEAIIILVTVIPPTLLAMYVFSEMIKLLMSRIKT